MKGLVGGFPIALLAAAALAQAQEQAQAQGVTGSAAVPTDNTATTTVNEEYNDDHSFELENDVNLNTPGYGGWWKRNPHGHESGVLNGASGDDVGNAASIPTVNSFSSEVNDEFHDNHEFDLDATTIIKPSGGRHWRRGEHPGEVLSGADGDDVGNAASIPTVNSFHSEVNDQHHDNHEVDVDATTIIKPGKPSWSHWRRGEVLSGADGDDVGNAASIPTVNTFSSELNDEYHDDHSVDVDATTIIKPAKHHWRRGEREGGVLNGAQGDDIGNAADIPTVNTFSSELYDEYHDNHSVDVDSKFVYKPHHKRHDRGGVLNGPSGDDIGNAAAIPTVNKFYSKVHDEHHDDHSIDVDATTILKPYTHPALGFHHPMHHARDDRDGVLNGASGDDIGNAADIPTINTFSQELNDEYHDDHSVDVDSKFVYKPHHKRNDRGGVLNGASGDDIGNAADIPTINTFSQELNDEYHDDHSFDLDSKFIVKPHKRAYHPEGGVLNGPSGDDVGNAASIPTVNTFDNEVNDAYHDDHHVKIDSTTIIQPAAPERPHWGQDHYNGANGQQPPVHSAPQTPAPAPVKEEEKPAAQEEHEQPQASSWKGEEKPVAQEQHEQPQASSWKGEEKPAAQEQHEQPQASSWKGEEKPAAQEQHEQPQASSWKGEEKPAAQEQHQQAQVDSPKSECTTVHQVVHTVTATRTSVQTHTAMVYPQPAETHSAGQEPKAEQGHGEQKGQEHQKEQEHEKKPEYQQEGEKEKKPEYQKEEEHEKKPEYQKEQEHEKKPESQQEGEKEKKPEYQKEQEHDKKPEYQQEGEKENASKPEPVPTGASSVHGSNSEDLPNPYLAGYQGAAAPSGSSAAVAAGVPYAGWPQPGWTYGYPPAQTSVKAPAAAAETPAAEKPAAAESQKTPVAAQPSAANAHASQMMVSHPAPAHTTSTSGAHNAHAASASAFDQIPVYVPSPVAHAHGSVVVASNAAMATHASSSMYRVHGASVPTGTSPEHKGHASSAGAMPSSSHGAMVFDGSAGRIGSARAMGVASVLAGAVAVLAFVL